jgi:hypothetical protein
MENAPGPHSFHEQFLWRVTGFPCELLEQFGLTELSSDLQQSISMSGARIRWRDHWAELSKVLHSRRFADRFQREFLLLRERLALVAASERFQAAVSASSPIAALSLSRLYPANGSPRRSRIRRLELLAIRYLQRFTMKCETSAFFGPVAAGNISELKSKVCYRYRPNTYEPRCFLGDRLRLGLVAQLRRNLELFPLLRVRRQSGYALGEQGIIFHPVAGVVRISELAATILARISRPMLLRDLLKGDTPDSAHVLIVVRALLETGLLTDDFDEAQEMDDPIGYFKDLLHRNSVTDASLRGVLERLSNGIRCWPRASSMQRALLAEEFSALLSLHDPPADRFFADHMPFVEDGCCRDAELILDRGWTADYLCEIAFAIQNGTCHDWRTGLRHRRALAAKLGIEAGKTISLPDVIAAFEDAKVFSRTGDIDIPSQERLIIISPDVMIAGRDVDALRRRDCDWILTENHFGIGCAGFPTRVMYDQEGWLASISQFLNSSFPKHLPCSLNSRAPNKTWHTGTLRNSGYLELGQPAPSGTSVIELEEIDVANRDGDLALVLRGSGQPLLLLPAREDEFKGVLSIFRLPRFNKGDDRRGRGVRHRVGSIITKRQSYSISADLPASDADSLEVFAWVQSQAAQERWPRWIVVRSRHERKPECIDTANPFLCEELVRLARRSPELSIDEMYPSPEEAWVQGPEGRYLSELRLLFASGERVRA